MMITNGLPLIMTCNSQKTCWARQAREKKQLVPSKGERATGAKRGKTSITQITIAFDSTPIG